MTKHCTYVAGCPLLLGKLAADLQQGEDSIISLHCAKHGFHTVLQWKAHHCAALHWVIACSAQASHWLKAPLELYTTAGTLLQFSVYVSSRSVAFSKCISVACTAHCAQSVFTDWSQRFGHTHTVFGSSGLKCENWKYWEYLMDIFYQHYKYKVGLSEKAGDPIYWIISYLDECILM